MLTVYSVILAMTVTINVSTKMPTYLNPDKYGLSTCSGIFISPDEVLTAAHCFQNSRGKAWAKVDGKSYEIKIKKIDPLADLALVEFVKPMNHAYIKFGRPVNIGDKVWTINSGEGWAGTYNEGIVNNIIEDEESFGTLTLLHSTEILHGASGSGLFNSNNQLVGINVAIYQGFSMAVDLLAINEFLNRR